jgi:hypothetical protein
MSAILKLSGVSKRSVTTGFLCGAHYRDEGAFGSHGTRCNQLFGARASGRGSEDPADWA